MIVLSGTNRPGANTRKVAGHIFELLKNKAVPGDLQLLDLAELKSDIFDPSCYAEKPAWFIDKFQTPILAAKGIVVVTPEYNGGFPGVLKYFIDMLKFPESLVGVPVAFIGVAAGQFAALRPVEQLEMLFNYRSAHIFGKRLFIPGIQEVVGADGSVGQHEQRLIELLDGFVNFAKQLSAK